MKIIKLLLLIVVLTSKFTILNAEVKPTFNKKFDLTGGVVDHPADVKFSPDGRKVFLLEFSSGNDTSDVELIQFTLTTPFDISSIDTSTKVSIIVDAGVGTASDATIAMELGCDAVLVNTAIAEAKDPILMAEAMKHSVIAGRKAFKAGRMKKREYGSPSSPPKDFK